MILEIGPLFLLEELQLWRNVALWASVSGNLESLAFGQIQKVVQVESMPENIKMQALGGLFGSLVTIIQ